jgi:type VII secretion integral membrane protein EccD
MSTDVTAGSATGMTADVCRVVLVAPHRTVELALPQTVPLADLIPVLVQRVTVSSRPGRSRRKNTGLTGHGDWVLQRLGGPPLDEDLTAKALRVHDGETLYLRPRDAQLPPVHFDDLIDGLATGLRHRPDRWRDSMTRAMFLVLCALLLAGCFVMLLAAQFPGRDRMALAISVILLVGAALCSRGLGDGWAGLTLSVAAAPFAALGGFLVPAQMGASPYLPADLLCTTVAASLVGSMAVAIVGEHRAVFLAVTIVGVAGTLGSLLALVGVTAAQAAATVATLTLITSSFAPGMAFRLARMRLPQLPTKSADLADDIEPYRADEIMAGAVAADTYLTWMSLAVGMICAVSTAVIALTGQTAEFGLIVAMSLVLMTRARGLTSGWQRSSALLPAVLGPLLLAVGIGTHAPDSLVRMAVLVVLLAAAAVALMLSRSMPGRRLTPYWGRLVDFFEYVFAIAMVLLLLESFGAYGWARAMAG